MQNYSIDRKDSKKFIKTYKIKKDKIITAFGNNSKQKVPYTLEKEQKILDQMESQVIEANYSFKSPTTITKLFAIMQPLMIPIAIYNFINHTNLFYAILLIIIGFDSIYYPCKIIEYNIKKRELEKMNFFIDNKEKLNSKVKEKEWVLNGVNKRAVRKIKKTLENRPIFDINSIDNYSLDDLKIIKANIEKEFASNFEYDDDNHQKGFFNSIKTKIKK